MARGFRAGGARIFTTRRLKYIAFIAPFFYITGHILYLTLDHSWPWIVVSIAALATSIGAFQTVLYRGRQPTIPAETDMHAEVDGDAEPDAHDEASRGAAGPPEPRHDHRE